MFKTVSGMDTFPSTLVKPRTLTPRPRLLSHGLNEVSMGLVEEVILKPLCNQT